ncbi:MAG: hypothetical protein WDM87_07765 [Terracidiphilus sp.]
MWGRWSDVDAARRLATGAGAVTLEIEQINVDALREVANLAPLRPGVEPVRIIQDKTLQKMWLAENGFPVGPFRVVRSEAELHEAVAALGGARVPEDRPWRIRWPRAGADRDGFAGNE